MNDEHRKERERELESLAKMFSDRYNMLVDQLERTGDLEQFELLPTIQSLDELDEFSRTLTTGEVFQLASAPDRANLAEARCVISDAVMHARSLDYDRARESLTQAMRKLMRVRNRKRAKELIPEVEEALNEVEDMLIEIISVFEAAERSFNGEVFAR